MRIIFAGTPEFAAQHLQALLSSDHEVVAVYTQPDRPAGRGNKLTPSAVKQVAQQHNLPVYQPVSLKDSNAQDEFKSINTDIMVVVAYGIILPLAILNTPRFGCVNVHGSILPRWRGAAPIQRAIWAGDKETGVTIMQMDEGLDTGDILHIAQLPIAPSDTSASLYNKLAELGPTALISSLDNFSSLKPIKQQNELATYAEKLSKQEAKVDWSNSAEQLSLNVRAFNPWPVVWFSFNDAAIKIWAATEQKLSASEQAKYQIGEVLQYNKSGLLVCCGEHALLITQLQQPNKKAQTIENTVNGQPNLFTVGEVLSS